jgi:hypothetical protein
MSRFHVRIQSAVDGLEARIELSGTIDEKAGFAHWGVVPPAIAVRIDCREIDGISAAGVRSWLRFFGALRSRQVRLSFENVPPILLDLLPAVPELIQENEVRPTDIPLWSAESPLKV